MQKSWLLLLLSIFSFYYSSAQYIWTLKANYAGGVRYGSVAFSIGAKGYCGTGLDGSINLTKDFWEYDTLSNTWTQKADIGSVGRFGAVALSIGNYGYVGLGTTSYPSYVWSTDFWQYDLISNTWTQKGYFPSSGRYALASFTIGNMGYIGGGWDGGDFNDFWQYDPSSDTWTQKASIGGGGRESSTGFSINDKGYVTTGLDGNTALNDLWEYDTLANTWTQKANLPGTVRYGATSFVLCNYAYVGLGSSNYPIEVELNDFWRYDPSADSWTQIVNFPDSARNGAVDFVIGTNAYIGTGAATTALSGFTNGFWEFNSDSCTAVAVPPPVAFFQSSDSTICANDCISFTDHSSNATAWQWSFDGATPSSSTDQNPQTVCYLAGGTYNVTLVASNSGGSDTLILANYISVFPAPPTPFIVQSNDTLYCITSPSYRSYQWYFNNAIVTGATDTFYVETQNGNYNLAVTDTNGCEISVGINILGVNEVRDNSYVTLYPNPATNQLTIHTSSFPNEAVMVSIMNVLGQEASPRTSLTPTLSKGEGEATIDVSKLAAGMYFVQLRTESVSVVGRFVKE